MVYRIPYLRYNYIIENEFISAFSGRTVLIIFRKDLLLWICTIKILSYCWSRFFGPNGIIMDIIDFSSRNVVVWISFASFPSCQTLKYLILWLFFAANQNKFKIQSCLVWMMALLVLISRRISDYFHHSIPCNPIILFI